jgi:hypothetical protein
MNLRSAEYCIFNVRYSKEEYTSKLAELSLDRNSGFLAARGRFFGEFRTMFPFRAVYQTRCENCEGTNHTNSKNLTACFEGDKSEDTVHSSYLGEVYSCADTNYAGFDRCELCYQAIGITDLFHGIAVDSCWHGSELAYCAYCFSCSKCFGCLSLQRGTFCVLNRQYSKDEYESIVARVIREMNGRGEWGRFFPRAFSPFGYNETVAQEWYPLPQGDAAQLGFAWRETAPAARGRPSAQMPEHAAEVHDEIVKEIWNCDECGRDYRVIAPELSLYRTLGVPLPRNCIDCRQRRRLILHSPWKLWTRRCSSCAAEVRTTFDPARPEKILCESCHRNIAY